jgi:thymidylate synthase
MNTATTSVIEALLDIEDFGIETSPRDQKVREIRDYVFTIDPMAPIANFNCRPANFSYTAGEFAWYLKGDRDISFIQKFSNFWNKIADDKNEINSNYGSLIIKNPQFKWAYDSLVNDKDTRQAVMFFNNPEFQYEGNKDFVCTMYINFTIREDMLYMKTNMRSQDIFYGFSYDIPWFSLVMQNMLLLLKETYPNLELGLYKHSCDNLHYYERHFEIATEIVNQTSYSSYSMELKKPMFTVTDEGVLLTKEAEDFVELVSANADKAKTESSEFWQDILKTAFNIKERRGVFLNDNSDKVYNQH